MRETAYIECLKSGKATLVSSAKDIIENYNFLTYKETEIQITFDDVEKQNIYNLLKKNPQTINQICRSLKQGVEEISACLSMLELEGIIEKDASGEYKIKCM